MCLSMGIERQPTKPLCEGRFGLVTAIKSSVRIEGCDGHEFKPLAYWLSHPGFTSPRSQPSNFSHASLIPLWSVHSSQTYPRSIPFARRLLVQYGRMPNGDFQGSVLVLVLYDVCDEISLSELRPLVGGKTVAPAFKHTTPEYVRFQSAPVVESLEAV